MKIIQEHTSCLYVKVLSIINDNEGVYKLVAIVRELTSGKVLAIELPADELEIKMRGRLNKLARLSGLSTISLSSGVVTHFELEDVFEFDEMPVGELFDQLRERFGHLI